MKSSITNLALGFLLLAIYHLGAVAVGAQSIRAQPITKAWLAGHGPAPWLLDKPNITYRLTDDVRTEGSAFIVGAANVTLDLNGHKVLYGDAPPIAVPNGGFEEGSGPADVPGWDLTGAPGAVRAPARIGMWGSWMLRIPSITATRHIISDAIMIPGGNHTYVATIATRGKDIEEVRLKVIDARTGKVLGAFSAKSAAWGYGPVTPFSVPSPGPVKLRIEIEPTPKASGAVDLDFAAIATEGECGIIASGSPWYFPPYLKTPRIMAASQRAKNFTLRNGMVIQGHGRGHAGNAVDCKNLDGMTIENVTTLVNGMDTVNINAPYTANPTIVGCTLQADIERITNRQANYAAISLINNRGRVLVKGNKIENYPQQGITVTANEPGGRIEIVDNVIKQRAIVTNGYGINLTGVHDFKVVGNKITPIKGRGIILDGWGKIPTANGDVAHNEVSVYEEPNLEYGASLEVTALRIRNWNGGAYHRHIHIHDNVFTARTDAKGVHGAIGMRIRQERNKANSDPCNVIENNHFKAIVATGDPRYSACGVSISHVDAGTGFDVSRNVMESNDTSLAFGDNDSYKQPNEDLLMVQNTIRRSSEGAKRKHRAVVVGAWRTTANNIRLIATKFDGGASQDLEFEELGSGNFGTGWLLDVSATGMPSGTQGTIRIEDKTGKEVFRGKLNDQGVIKGIPLVTTFYQFNEKGPKSVTAAKQDPFRVIVQAGQMMASQQVNIFENTKVRIELREAGKSR
jgi:hypothetical protein